MTRFALAVAALLLIPGCGSAPAEPFSDGDRFSVAPSRAFRVGAGEELLVCYGFEPPPGDKRHIVRFEPRLDNGSVLHHMTLLAADRAVSSDPAACDADAMSAWRSLYGWAPGTSSFELPLEAGFAVEPGSHFAVQLHYVNTQNNEQDDASGFELGVTSELRPNDADIMAFGTHEFRIPSRGELSVDCSVAVPDGGATTHLFAAFPHMHRLGTAIATRVIPRDGGSPVDIGKRDPWDFDEQSWIPIDYTLRPGDVVESNCTWQNPGQYAVGFGPSTEDEMCYSFTMYYPRIEDPNWHWALPALYSVCAP